MTRKGRVLVPATVPFWLKPASTFGLLSLTMFIERSPGFAIPSILAPLRLGADRDIVPSRFRRQSVMWLYSSGHTETRNSHSQRGVFDEPTRDEKVSCGIQG